MRLLLLIPELGYGGAETALLRLAQQLALNHVVTIAVFQRAYRQPGYAQAHLPTTLPIAELDQSGAPLPPLMPAKLARWWRRIRELRQLKRHHDVTISFLSGANLLNALIRCGKPAVISERGSQRHDRSRNFISRLLWCWFLAPMAYRFATRVVCVSEGLSQEVRASLPRRCLAKVITIAGYLDASQALAAAEEPIEPECLALASRPLLVAAGRLHPQKGFDFLLPLFASASRYVPRCGLLLIGDGPQMVELVDQAHSLRLSVCVCSDGQPLDPEAQVIFLGYRPQPARYTRVGRAFVMSSLHEGLPNLLLEAIAAGSWCLAADCSYGPAEVLQDPQLGSLLPPIDDPSNQQLWIEALRLALARPAVFSIPPEVRLQHAQRFSIQASAQRWEELVLSLS